MRERRHRKAAAPPTVAVPTATPQWGCNEGPRIQERGTPASCDPYPGHMDTAPVKPPLAARRNGYPEVADLDSALHLLRSGLAFTPGPLRTREGLPPTAAWQGWVFGHVLQVLTLRVECESCHARWDPWQLSVRSLVAEPVSPWGSRRMSVLAYSENISRRRGFNRDAPAFQARGTLFFRCTRRDCPRDFPLRGEIRTIMLLQALKDNQDRIIA